MQRAEFETKLNRVCLHIYKEEHYEEDYQMPMLRQNRLEGILEVEGCEVGGSARYTYEISGMISMKTMYENTNMKKQEIESVITRILEVTETLQCYMLNPNCLVLKPEYIFYKENNWYFCYFPGMEEDLCKLFHELTEYFVKMLDYQDTEGIFLAYELHKATLQEHYDLELIMKEYRNRESERKKLIREKNSIRQEKENKENVRRKSRDEKPDDKRRVGYGRTGSTEGTGYNYERIGSMEYNYGGSDNAGDQYGDRKSEEYVYGRNEKADGDPVGYGNIFCVADEDEADADRLNNEKQNDIHMADTICEEGGGGWWKSWRKAANGIRRKRWGSWDDLILETDGQEEES